ncbi:MAG: enoyl-CoA hydratase-related protein [Rhizobiaceae bacterium]
MSDIEISRSGPVARISLNRPETLNALRRETFKALTDAVAALSADRAVRALVLTGSGRAFSSGADLSDPMMGSHLPREEQPAVCAQVLDTLMNRAMRAIRNAPFPTVAAVNGIAAGGGVGLALAADIVVAARSARFVQTFTPKLGLIPDLGSTWHLARHLGRARALGLVLTGEPIDGEKAAALGLIWKCVADEELAAEADRLAVHLANGPTGAQVTARRLVDAAFLHDFDAQLDAERDAQASLVAGDDVNEAMRAFKEKRPAVFASR